MNPQRRTANHGVPWEDEYGYAQAVKKGNTIYLSGQVSHDAEGNLVGKDDMHAQMKQAYANAEKLLEELGASFADVIDETVYATDVDAAYSAHARLKIEIYGEPVAVASSLIGTTRLGSPGYLVEIKMVAVAN